MEKKLERCNICGVPESKWENGVCSACVRCSCEITDDLIIEERVYRYAEKHDLLNGDTFQPETARKRLEHVMANRRGPKYFKEAISCDGQVFNTLADFPIGQVYRVCRGSNDGSFTVSDLVWRSPGKDGIMDGINFIQEAGCLEPEFCDAALQGAMFEPRNLPVPERRF